MHPRWHTLAQQLSTAGRCVRQRVVNLKVIIFWTGTLLLALFAVAITMPIITVQPFGFDEGWIAQAPRNLAQHGLYASYGAAFNGQDKVFDPFLSTGPSVTVPMAGVFAVFGAGVVQARVVMLTLYIATLLVLAWYAFYKTRSLYAWGAPLGLLLLSSSGIPFRIDILGEVAAVLYATGSLLAFNKRRFVLAGVLAALAVLAKFIMILLLVAGCAYFGLQLLARWRQKRRISQDAGRWVVGAAVPLLLWEVVRFVQTGGGHAYIASLREFARFFINNGSGVGDTGSMGLTIPYKFEMLLSNIGLARWLMVVAAVAVVLVLWQRWRFIRQVVTEHLYAVLFVGMYLAWWLIISNGAYTRYTVPLAVMGLVLLLRLVLSAYHAGLGKKAVRWPGWLIHLPLLVVMLVLARGFVQVYLPLYTPVYSYTLHHQQQVADRILAAKPGRLTHYGWWQNPEILFMSGLHSKEINQLPTGEHFSLLLSPAMRDIAPLDYQRAQQRCTDVVFEDSGYILCTGIKPSPEGP